MKMLNHLLVFAALLTFIGCNTREADIADSREIPVETVSDVVVQITEDNFQTEVLESSKPVLVDFWAPWCGPCRQQGPVVDLIAEEMIDTVKVGKVNTDDAQGLAQQFQVASIPTLIVFKDGKPIERIEGFTPYKSLSSTLKKLTSE